MLLMTPLSGDSIGRALSQTLRMAGNAGVECINLCPWTEPAMTWWSTIDTLVFGEQIPVPIDFPRGLILLIRNYIADFDNGSRDDLNKLGRLTLIPEGTRLPNRFDDMQRQGDFIPLAVVYDAETYFWSARVNADDLQFWRIC